MVFARLRLAARNLRADPPYGLRHSDMMGAMARATHPSICRFCHANCGILVEIEDGRPVRVTGDRANPAYHGFTCAKGRQLPALHAHPDRLLHSLERVAPGRFEPIASAQAIDQIAARISALRCPSRCAGISNDWVNGRSGSNG